MLTVPFTAADLEDESLGFVKEGWMTIEIKTTLFDEQEFNKEIAYVPKSLDQAPCTWKESDFDKWIREGML